MGRGKSISEFERGQVKAYKAAGLSIREIAGKLKRSKNLVADCLSRGTDIAPKVSTGRKKKLMERDERNVVRHGSNRVISSSKIKSELNLPVSSRTIRRTLAASPHLDYRKMKRKPKVTPLHAEERRAFAHVHHTWTDKWHRVIFSDEKRFNLDGPDGWSYYWHDLRKDELVFSKRQQGGGSVMIWFGFSWDRATPVVFIEENLNATRYKNILSTHLAPLVDSIEEIYDAEAIFQQDNARAHTAHATQDWLDSKGITVLEWPANSPDLNPTENVFGALARRVYAGSRQFGTVAALKEAILEAWADIDFDELEPYIDSMPDRMEAVIASHGKPTRF